MQSVQSTSQWKVEKALWLKGTVKGSDTVKVKKDIREETVKASRQGKTVKNTGWDFSIGRNHTGTIRSNVRPPQVRERKSEVSQNKVASRRAEDSSNWLSPTGTALSESSEVSFRKDAKDQYPSEDDNFHEDEDSSTKGPGTVVIRCPRGSQTSLFSHDQSTLSQGTNASFEDASTTGIVVFHGQQDGSESPWTPKSRFGIQERSSSASLEDSALNLAEARAAIQAGMRSGNARERPALSKIRDALGNISREHASKNGSDSSRNSQEYCDAPKVLLSSCNASDDEESANTLSASAHLSVLLIPSLKGVTHDDTDGPLVRAVTNSLVNLERVRAGSCEFLMSKLLQMLFKGTIAEGLAGTSNPHFLKGHNMSARLG